jgi:hypothetical protein
MNASTTQTTQDARTFEALIGMSQGEFDDLLVTFTRILHLHALRQRRRRAIGGCVKGVLDSSCRKLFFVLFYLKVYPTFDVLVARFAKPRAQL